MSLTGIFDTLRTIPAYQKLTKTIWSGERISVTVPDTAKPYLLATLWAELKRPVVIICPQPDNARRMAEQLASYCDQGSPLHHFVESEVLTYERLHPDATTACQRLSALGALRQQEGAPLVVTSTIALMQPTISVKLIDHLAHTIQVGQMVQLEPLLSHWARMGYTFGSFVDGPGKASRRGGIIDIHTPNMEQPVRLELFGNKVESLNIFDPRTQRSVTPISEITVMPSREILPGLSNKADVKDLIRKLDYTTCHINDRNKIETDLSMLLDDQSGTVMPLYSGFFNTGILLDHLNRECNPLVVMIEPNEGEEAARHWSSEAELRRLHKQNIGELPIGFPSPVFHWQALAPQLISWAPHLGMSRLHQATQPKVIELPFRPATNYLGRLDQLEAQLKTLRSKTTVIASQHSLRLKKLLLQSGIQVTELRDSAPIDPTKTISIVHDLIDGGWELYNKRNEDNEAVLTVLTDKEVFGTSKKRAHPTKKAPSATLDLDELHPGDYVVHMDHGIARFAGTTRMDSPAQENQGENGQREYLVLEYAERDKLYIPMEHFGRVSAYVGGGETSPSPTRLGTQEWERAVRRARESTKQLATDLLSLYAQRELAVGHSYPPDTPWQQEMEDSFPYPETPDQVEAITQVKIDMESSRPMERIVCGDVGYGKTEIALRSAFKAVMDNKQVALLVPTTLLAHQHYTTFTERLSAFPIKVDHLSRFRSKREQAEIIKKLATGEVDIIIGTHRLLQKDVAFKNLGLAIVDEEHRFGVDQKERLKSIHNSVDLLTMTATPIPRTLHMALSGLRDISSMETPPEQRLPVTTYLAEHSDDLIREAILREMDRGGQVFYLHNRVRSIQEVESALQLLVPEAVIVAAHGRMDETELARTMEKFLRGEAHVLVCTTIIESGLDIPSVNTLIIDRADRLGLAQLYQLRGRVGRSAHRAYAYLFIPRGQRISDVADLRLQTILAATELGAGFRIAMKDLQIRGAGNLLGPDQSGHVQAVGFDFYMHLLSEAVSTLRTQVTGEPTQEALSQNSPRARVDLGLPAYIPEELVDSMPDRVKLYQRLALVETNSGLEDFTKELRDRFGPLPEEVHNLLYEMKIQMLATSARIEAVIFNDNRAVLRLYDSVGDARLALQKALGDQIQVGNKQLHLPKRSESLSKWKSNLVEIIERLIKFHHRTSKMSVIEI